MTPPSSSSSPPPSFTLPVRAVEQATPRALAVALDSHAASFAFRPGQAVWLGRRDQAVRKPYSIASAPDDHRRHGALEFLVGLEDTGHPGAHLANLAKGTLVEMAGPLGGIELPTPGSPGEVMLVAGGTGVAPLRSIWRELLAHPPAPPLSVVYSARRSEDFAYGDELRQLHREGRARVAMTITRDDPAWEGLRGRVTAELFARHLVRPGDARCAICGPAAFVAHVAHALTRLGVPLAQIATERW